MFNVIYVIKSYLFTENIKVILDKIGLNIEINRSPPEENI